MARFPVAALGLVALLAACTGNDAPVPETIVNPATRPVAVNPGEAAAMLSQLRTERGLSSVRADTTLNAIARDYAELMAARGQVAHDLGEALAVRLDAGGYAYLAAFENLGGGYRSLAEAFERWEASPSHRENLFAEPVSEIGIATAFSIASPYRTFWVLLLAEPRPPP